MRCLQYLVFFHEIILIIKVFQPIFIKLGMYVKIKETCHGKISKSVQFKIS